MWVSNSNTCSAAVFMRGLLAAETTVTCCQSFIYTSELFRSTKTSGLWLLSDWRSEICGVPVQKRWCQRWEVLHHPQEPVASLKPEGKKKYIFSKNIISSNVARTLVTGPPCLHFLRLWPTRVIPSRRPSPSARRSFTCRQAKASRWRWVLRSKNISKEWRSCWRLKF